MCPQEPHHLLKTIESIKLKKNWEDMKISVILNNMKIVATFSRGVQNITIHSRIFILDILKTMVIGTVREIVGSITIKNNNLVISITTVAQIIMRIGNSWNWLPILSILLRITIVMV